MAFMFMGVTILTIGGILYIILKKSSLNDRATCMLCGKQLEEIYSEGAYAFDTTKPLIELEHKCVKCGGKMALKN